MPDLNALALNAARELTAVELHGAICGLAVCYPEGFPLESLLALVGVDAVADEYSVESFVAASVESLLAEDLSFAPLLPDDSLAVNLRLEGLAQWCAAFLAGLAAGLGQLEVGSIDQLPKEAREIIADLSAITNADHDGLVNARDAGEAAEDAGEAAEDGGEDAEADLMQLEEFVKVAVLLLMSLVNDAADSGGSGQ